MVERRAAGARMSLGWVAWWERRWVRAVRKWGEWRKGGRVEDLGLEGGNGGGMPDVRSFNKEGVERGAYGSVAATRGCWAWMEGGRVLKRRPSRTPPWAKEMVVREGRALLRAEMRKAMAGIWVVRRVEMRKVEEGGGSEAEAEREERKRDLGIEKPLMRGMG